MIKFDTYLVVQYESSGNSSQMSLVLVGTDFKLSRRRDSTHIALIAIFLFALFKFLWNMGKYFPVLRMPFLI